MTTVIKSGDGGNIAKVDDDNRLWTNTKANAAEEVAAHNGNAFILHGACRLAVAGSGGLFYFKSTDSVRHVHLTRMFFDCRTLSDDIIIYQVKNPTTVSGGTDISSTGIVNKNFTSGNAVTGTLVYSDASNAITYSGGTNFHSFVVESKKSYFRNMNGTNMLSNNDTILWGWETLGGGNAATTDIISLSINFYRRPVE